MSRIVNILIMLSLVSFCYSQEWEFTDDFVTLNGSMGIEIDKNGLIWTGSYSPSETLISGEETINVSPIYIFYEDGTQASFSPIYFLEYNSIIDTITACRAISQDSNGNILLTYRNTAYSHCVVKIDYQTADCIGKRQFENSTGRATSDSDGNVFVASIVPGYPIEILDPDLNLISELDTLYTSYQRGVEVVNSGMHYEVFVGLLIDGNPDKGGEVVRYTSENGIQGPWERDSLRILPAGWQESPLLNDLQFDNYGNMWVFFSGGNEGGLFVYDTSNFSIIETVGSFKPRLEQGLFEGDSLSYLFDVSWTSDGRTMYSADYFGSTIKKWHYANPGELIFSEVIEGSSNNKAIEIYNASTAILDLTNYRIAWCANGCENEDWEYWHEFPAATLNPGDVWVLTTDAAATEINNVADELLPYTSPAYQNGDDALGLIRIIGSDTTLLDRYGDDIDPGSGWVVAGVVDATRDHTLIRKSSVTGGNTNWASSAGTNVDDSEWIVMGIDFWESLGSHPFDSTQSDTPSIIIDGDISDWTSVPRFDLPPNPQEGLEDVQGSSGYPERDFKDIYVTHDEKNLYFRLDMNDNANLDALRDGPGLISLGLDVDNSNATGLTWNWWATGVDYFVGWVGYSEHIGVDDSVSVPAFVGDCSSCDDWDQTGYWCINAVDSAKSAIELSIPLSALEGLQDSIRFIVLGEETEQWSGDYYPDNPEIRTATYYFDSSNHSNPSSLTFQVDMSNEIVSSNGVHVAGSFNGWQPDSTELTDPDGDGIYSCTLLNETYGLVKDDVIEYKFINNNSWDSDYEIINNRIHTVSGGVDILPSVCFNHLVPCGDLFTEGVWYVSISGDDLFGNGTFDNPLASIQEAINRASVRDTVLVLPGTYNENISIGMELTLASRFLLSNDPDDISSTIIHGTGTDPVIHRDGSEPTYIAGFTISGGSIGVNSWSYPFTISNCLITGNDTGVRLYDCDSTEILNCTITENSSTGIYVSSGAAIPSYPYIINTIIANNGETEIKLVAGDSSMASAVQAHFAYCDIYPNSIEFTPNMPDILIALYEAISHQDPELNGAWMLQNNSPCIDAGTDLFISESATILQLFESDYFGLAPDLGCFESPWAGPTESQPDVFPAPNAQNVDQQTDITVTFGFELDPFTLNASTFVVHASQSGRHTGVYSYDAGTNTVSLNINDPFAAGEIVSATLTDGIHTADHEAITPFQWEFRIESTGGYATFNIENRLPTNHNIASMEVADLDSDGMMDIIAGWGDLDSMSLFRNVGAINFNFWANYYTGASPNAIVSADFDGDRHMDIASAGYASPNKITILRNDGAGRMLEHSEINVGSVRKLIPGDIDNDGDIDLVVDLDDDANLSTYLNNGDGTFSLGNEFYYAVSAKAFTLADVDNDGDLDLIQDHDDPYRIIIAENNGDGDFSWAKEIEIAGEVGEINTCDIEGDGDIDLLVPIDSSIVLLDNIGGFVFDQKTLLNAEDFIQSCKVSDLDGDADLDIILKYRAQTKFSYFLNNGHGEFGSPTSISTAPWGDPIEIQTFDAENDGDIDIIVSTEAGFVFALNGDTLIQQGTAVAESMSNFLTEQSGDVLVDYVLVDDDNDLIDILLEYSIDSGSNWAAATTSGAISNIGSDQYSGSIIWNSRTDLPGIDTYKARLRLTPNDGNVGISAESNDFHLDNNLAPNITNISLPDSIVVVAALSYELSDAENDTLDLRIEYSVDNGTSWVGGNSTQAVNTIIPGRYTETQDWFSYKHLGFQRLQNIWIKFSVSDNDPGADTILKNISVLNLPAEYNGDMEITAEDLAIFASAWNAEPQELAYEIGPASGTVPELTTTPDGVLDFEDLAVFVQMWNWSFMNNGLTKPSQLAKVNSESMICLDVDIRSPENEWVPDRNTSVVLTTDREDILQVELMIDKPTSDIFVNYSEGDYFDERFHTSPVFREISSDSSLSSFCITGLGVKDSQSGPGTVAELSLSNLTGMTQTVNLLYKVWSISGAVMESGQISLELESQLPDKYSLEQNFPNPFNPSTTIRYTLREQTDVHLNIYNIRGELVRTLMSGSQQAGYYQLNWAGEGRDGEIISAGLYFGRIQTPKFSKTIKMVYLK